MLQGGVRGEIGTVAVARERKQMLDLDAVKDLILKRLPK